MPLRFFVVLLIAAVFLRAGDDFTRKQYISKKINKKKTSLNILALAGVSLVPAFLFAAGSKNKNFKNEAYTSGVVVSIPVALGWTLFFREMHTFHQRKAAAVSAVQSEEVRLKIKGKVNDELSNAVICRAVFKAFPVEDLSQSVITDPRDGSFYTELSTGCQYLFFLKQKEKTVYKDMLDLRDITGTATTNLYIALRASELDTEIQEIFSLSNIYFQSGSYELSPAARHTLASYCDFLKKQSNLGVKILGHADDRGSQLFNLRLSRKRAQSVADFLTACGMPREQIKIKAYGEKRPLLTGTGNEVYQQNRRVEFKIISLTNVPPSVERE